jgi:SAM-dependent methyltransferase
LLHHGGPPSAWGNLGLWSSADQPYADACRALADRVAAAAGLGPGQRVVSLACGSGEELRHWVQAHGVHSALGVEADAQRARRARRRMARAGLVAQCPVVVQPALAWAARRGAHDARFDAVLCVDAAYHLSPRLQLLRHALALLQPGARLAFTDLVLDRQAAAAPWLRAAARLCGVPHVDLVPADERLRQLQAAGFVDVLAERLDDAAPTTPRFPAAGCRPARRSRRTTPAARARRAALQALQRRWLPASTTGRSKRRGRPAASAFGRAAGARSGTRRARGAAPAARR